MPLYPAAPPNSYVSTVAAETLADKGALARTNIGARGPARGTAGGVHDDFKRADGALDGSLAPTGHTYRVQGTNHQLTGGQYAPQTPATTVNIAYVDHDRPLLGVVHEFAFTAGATNQHNAVIGACARTFGSTGDGGSVQLGVWFNGINGNGTGDDWQVFNPLDPVVDPYHIIAHGNFLAGFKPQAGVVYRAEMYRVGQNQAAVVLPDGQIVLSPVDATIGSGWGNCAAIQLRRQLATDGYAVWESFHAIPATPWDRPQLVPGAIMNFTGSDFDSVMCNKPAAALTGDIAIKGSNRPTTWTPASSMILGRWWGTDGGSHSLLVFLNAAGRLVANWTQDGNTVMGVQSTAVLPFTNGQRGYWAITRTVADGVVKYWTATDPTALDDSEVPGVSVKWTQLGANTATTAGAIWQSNAVVECVRRSTTANLNLTGGLEAFKIYNGIGSTLWCGIDLRASAGEWTGIDAAFNRWTPRGTGWYWSLDEAQITGLVADLTGTSAFASDCASQPNVNGAGAGAGVDQVLFTFAQAAASIVKVGTSFLVSLGGTVDGVATSGAITGKLKVNGTQVSSFTIAQSLTGAQVGKAWTLEAKIEVIATGAGGSVQAWMGNDGVAAGGGNIRTAFVPTGPVAIDLSGGLTVEIDVNFATANAGNIARLLGGFVSHVART